MPSTNEKAQDIRLLILDVDGILTSGVLYYSTDDNEFKGFHTQDGLGIKLLQKAGIPVAIISSKSPRSVKKRIKDLGIEHSYLGQEDKLPAYEELKQTLKLSDNMIAYMGDDLPDLPILRRVGLAITVPQATAFVQQHCHLVTARKGGKGAVREVCELILASQHKLDAAFAPYLV